MRKFAILGSLMAMGLAGIPANAHHAVQAQFDVTKNVILVGTLKKIDWQNPHAWFHCDVKGQDGAMTTWSVETIGPNGLRRLGISDRRLFQIGTEYKIDIHPDRSGKNL